MFRVAILGYRVQGKRHHAPAFAKLPDCRIVAICDMVPERAEEGARHYGVTAYTDMHEMLDREEIDIVDIPVGERYRYEPVMECLRRGKHIFTEKPLAGGQGQFKIRFSDLPRVREMIDEWQRQSVYFGICFGLHTSPNVKRVKELIASGELGEFRHIHAYTAPGPWNHIIDMVRHLGGEVSEVFAYGDENMRTKVATLKFENQRTGTLVFSSDSSLQFQIRWVGEKGEAIIENIAGRAWWRLHGQREVVRWEEDIVLDRATYDRIFDSIIAEFVGCLKEGRRFVADGWAGLRHMEIDASITESILSGKPIPVPHHRPEQGRVSPLPGAN